MWPPKVYVTQIEVRNMMCHQETLTFPPCGDNLPSIPFPTYTHLYSCSGSSQDISLLLFPWRLRLKGTLPQFLGYSPIR